MSDITPVNHSICWLRRDLRVRDNKALSQAIMHSDQVTVVFVFDTQILSKLKNKKDRRVVFIHRSLQEIDTFLQKMGSKLVVLKGDPAVEIPKLALGLSVKSIYANMDIEPYAKKRDALVEKKLISQKMEFITCKDHVIFAKDEILNEQKKPYQVFTPYKKKWLAQFEDHMTRDVTLNRYTFTPYEHLKKYIHDWRLQDIGFEDCELLIDPGEEYAQMRLKTFAKHMAKYKELRDYPIETFGTSGLSVALRFGTISIRDCVRTAKAVGGEGGNTWLSELIWREFYQMLLDQFPNIVSEPFQSQYKTLVWPGKKEHFKAWTQGQTGYPLVDAAMRCLNETGWMHNRLRMVVAMFLTKDLLVDWKLGEDYFAEHLVDFELASNNGGWQWSASVGCDAQPYFRIFNPIAQSQKFDARGDFIRQFCPELVHFSAKSIHEPWKASEVEQEKAGCMIGKDYPRPIVDHKVMREKAIALFKAHR